MRSGLGRGGGADPTSDWDLWCWLGFGGRKWGSLGGGREGLAGWLRWAGSNCNEKFSLPTGGFFLAPAEGWKAIWAQRWFWLTYNRTTGLRELDEHGATVEA